MTRRKLTMPCPIAECAKLRDPNQIFCASHWFKVPKAVREEIWDAWRDYSGDPDMAKLARYRSARAAAFAALGAVEA